MEIPVKNWHVIPLELTATVMATETSAPASLQQTLCLYRNLVGNIWTKNNRRMKRGNLYIHTRTHTHTRRFNLVRNAVGGPKSKFFFNFRGATAPNGPGSPCYRFLVITLDMSQLVGLLWMSDRPEAETSTDSTQHSQETIHDSGNIRT
jgi:hypothetical protein